MIIRPSVGIYKYNKLKVIPTVGIYNSFPFLNSGGILERSCVCINRITYTMELDTELQSINLCIEYASMASFNKWLDYLKQGYTTDFKIRFTRIIYIFFMWCIKVTRRHISSGTLSVFHLLSRIFSNVIRDANLSRIPLNYPDLLRFKGFKTFLTKKRFSQLYIYTYYSVALLLLNFK